MTDPFKYLFAPLKIGSATVPNRIFMAPMGTNFGTDEGLPNETLADYFEARAKGGAGLIITGGLVVHHSGISSDINIRGYDERCIPGLKRVADTVHQYKTKIFCQLWHGGRQLSNVFSRSVLWAPSPISCAVFQEIPHEMDLEEIRDVIQGFARTAGHVREGGCDGVEINATHGYLIQQFMSPLTNMRVDNYGGSLENRLRFATEVIAAVRKAVGEDFVVGIRIPGDELLPGGLTLDDMKEIARRLEATGKIDYVHVTIGTYTNISVTVPPMYFPIGFNVQSAAGIRGALEGIPVFTAGRINDPVQAEKILNNGQADMVGMGRALLADPELPNKAQKGRLDDIRPCIACNQGCIARVFSNGAVSCLQNPSVGRESEMGAMKFAKTKKKILVVGGGPGGMKAAEVAALRGHEVVVYEKEELLGGQVNIVVKVPSRHEFEGCIRYLIRQMDKLRVKVYLKNEATLDTVKAEDPDIVVIATGSTPFIPPIPGTDQANVLTVWNVLKGDVEVGRTVVVVDGGEAHWQCCGAAEYLAEKGKEVEIITPRPFVGMGLALTLEQPLLYHRLLSNQVIFSPNTFLTEISGNSITVFNVYTNTERKIEGVETVVLAMGNVANDQLYRTLKKQEMKVYGVGDCMAPRKVLEAIYEGDNVGRNL